MAATAGEGVLEIRTGRFCMSNNKRELAREREREELKGCFNSRRKESVSERRPGCWL